MIRSTIERDSSGSMTRITKTSIHVPNAIIELTSTPIQVMGDMTHTTFKVLAYSDLYGRYNHDVTRIVALILYGEEVSEFTMGESLGKVLKLIEISKINTLIERLLELNNENE